MEQDKKYDHKGREIIKTIEQDNFIIEIVKHEYKEKNLDNLYKTIAKLLYKEASI